VTIIKVAVGVARASSLGVSACRTRWLGPCWRFILTSFRISARLLMEAALFLVGW